MKLMPKAGNIKAGYLETLKKYIYNSEMILNSNRLIKRNLNNNDGF